MSQQQNLTRIKQLQLEQGGQANLFEYALLGDEGRALERRDKAGAKKLEESKNNLADFGEHILRELPSLAKHGYGFSLSWLRDRFKMTPTSAKTCIRAAMLRKNDPHTFSKCISPDEVLALAPRLPVGLLAQSPEPEPEPVRLADDLPPPSELPGGKIDRQEWTANISGQLSEDKVRAVLDRMGISYREQETLPIFDKLGRSPKRVDFLVSYPKYPSGLIIEVKASRGGKPNIPEKIVFDIESMQECYGIPSVVVCDGEALETNPHLLKWAEAYYQKAYEKAEKTNGASPLRFLGMMPLRRFEEWMMQLSQSK